MAAPQASSRLEMLQARFQQRQLLEKEQKLLQLYDQQQLRAQQVAQRGSAGSNGSNSSGHGTNSTSTHHQTVTRTSTQSTSNSQGGGKVRQMFDERRQTTVKGIDKSYPLEPLDNRSRKQQTTTTSNVVASSTSPLKNGNPMSNRQTVMTRRTVRSEANSNVNGGKPIVSYHEEVSQESCGPTNRANEQEEFGDDNDQVSRYANGNPHIDRRSEIRVEDVANDNINQRHRTTAKIHLAGFDGSNETNRIVDDLDNERFPEDLMMDVPDRLPRRGPAAKKPSQAEARLERFKNSNTKKTGKTTKQVAGNTTSFTKKRTETTSTHSGSSSRASTVTRTMEEETSRASSPSPDLVRTGRPRSSSPEVVDRERKLTRPIVDRTSSVAKNSCISKVSQLTHKNSMDFYPRRKSEFEKSKTFRKLQLELGESSPEPAEPDEEIVPYAKQQCRKRSSILDSNVYSVGRRSSSSSPTADCDRVKQRKHSREQTPETPKSRRGSESPVYQKKSMTSDDSKTISSTTRTTMVESNIDSCRRRSSSSNYATDRDLLKERRTSHEKFLERPQSRRGSVSPFNGRKSSVTREHIERSSADSNVYLSRRRSSSASPVVDRETSKDRRASHESSPERPASRRGSESPMYRRRSTVTSEETTTTSAGGKVTRRETTVTRKESTSRNESPLCARVMRKRSESPREDLRRSSMDREQSRVTNDSRRSSGGTLRSVELVKKLVRPENPKPKAATSPRRSSERRTTLEDVEFPINVVNRTDATKRTKSPMHRIVKKDKVLMEPSKEDTKMRDTSRKNSRETIERDERSRSRTISPSPPSRRTMKETASFRAKKTERRNATEVKRNETKYHQEVKKNNEINKKNLSNERSKKCQEIFKQRSPSPEENKTGSRRSSSETTVRRHDTFKVNRPSQRFIEIESSVDNEKQSSDKRVKGDANDKSQLLERIEKIRTTLSRSGRSEQNLQSKDFERTDSVESALRRFDSIGVETEHQITVGVDEPDRFPVNLITSKETSDNEKNVAKKSVTSRSKPAVGIVTVGIVKAQPKRIDAKTRDSSKEKFRQKSVDAKKIVKVEKERSVRATTPRKDENKIAPKSRPSQKIVKSLVRKSKLREEEPSGRGEGKEVDRSPLCKRRLFKDSDSEIEIDTDNSRSTVVLSTIIRVTKSPETLVAPKPKNRDRLIPDCEYIPAESCIIESKTDIEQPTKVLRSIEDIRKSIERESQDFKRELNKFNTAMKRDREQSKSACPDGSLVSGTISRVQITKTMKTGDEAPIVKIERSTVKLPITHRVAKSPSPDIGTKRTTEGRARTPTASIRRSVPSSPAKSPDATTRYGSAELKGPKASSRPSTSPSSMREEKNRWESSQTMENEYSDTTDGPGNYFQSTITESVTVATKKNDDFAVELDDDEVSGIKDNAFAKSPLRKQSSERSLTSQRQQRSPTSTPLPRPASALSTASSAGSTRGQVSNNRSKMSTKTKTTTSSASKGPPASARGSIAAAVNDGLAPCKICGRRFNSDRITLHEQICLKTATKKRKQFDATSHRVKGTELEPFVKKGASKKPQADRKGQKPDVKSNWRRKHEDFINAIRSAKQVQAHLAAGGKLSDLPPPPASDTSDYVQCPHCGRKFNQGAAERHIPKCQNMLHNKPNPRAPPKPKR